MWKGLNFEVNSSITNSAKYNYATNTITFKSSSDIDKYNVIEEFFHAYQNTIYPEGTCQYHLGTPGYTNIEFEAKLFKDIFGILRLMGMSGSIGFPRDYKSDYGDWVFNLSLETSMERFNQALLEKYSTMLGYFNQYDSEYGGYLLPGLDRPQAIFKSKSGCYEK